PVQDRVEPVIGLEVGEGKRFVTAELQGVLLHDGQISADVGCEVGFVDDEEVRFDHALTGLARNLLTLGDVDDVHREIHQLGAEGRREVIATGFNKHNVEVLVAALELFDGRFVHRGVFANRGVRAATGFNTDKDRKSTRLNSSHVSISYAVFCLKKKKTE